jgi:hypothetical protein
LSLLENGFGNLDLFWKSYGHFDSPSCTKCNICMALLLKDVLQGVAEFGKS